LSSVRDGEPTRGVDAGTHRAEVDLLVHEHVPLLGGEPVHAAPQVHAERLGVPAGLLLLVAAAAALGLAGRHGDLAPVDLRQLRHPVQALDVAGDLGQPGLRLVPVLPLLGRQVPVLGLGGSLDVLHPLPHGVLLVDEPLHLCSGHGFLISGTPKGPARAGPGRGPSKGE
jgi:hypothetical protein